MIGKLIFTVVNHTGRVRRSFSFVGMYQGMFLLVINFFVLKFILMSKYSFLHNGSFLFSVCEHKNRRKCGGIICIQFREKLLGLAMTIYAC